MAPSRLAIFPIGALLLEELGIEGTAHTEAVMKTRPPSPTGKRGSLLGAPWVLDGDPPSEVAMECCPRPSKQQKIDDIVENEEEFGVYTVQYEEVGSYPYELCVPLKNMDGIVIDEAFFDDMHSENLEIDEQYVELMRRIPTYKKQKDRLGDSIKKKILDQFSHLTLDDINCAFIEYSYSTYVKNRKGEMQALFSYLQSDEAKQTFLDNEENFEQVVKEKFPAVLVFDIDDAIHFARLSWKQMPNALHYHMKYKLQKMSYPRTDIERGEFLELKIKKALEMGIIKRKEGMSSS